MADIDDSQVKAYTTSSLHQRQIDIGGNLTKIWKLPRRVGDGFKRCDSG